MSILQHEYEISIWKDVWAKPTLFDDNGNVTHVLNGEDVLDEEKSAVLSTDNMTFGGKSINNIFKTKINGTHELTFDLPAKYIDPSTGKKVKNYLHDLIDNETKIKLHYKGEWFTFYVKKVVEKRDKGIMQYSYTCEDSFITELSKTGYKLTFNEYTDHYVEEIHTFAKDILDGSEWQYDEKATKNNCDLIEYQEEKLVCYKVRTAGGRKLIGSENHHLYESTLNTIPAGATVYGFYSEVGQSVKDTYGYGVTGGYNINGGGEIKQVIYVPPTEEYIISGNTIANKNCNYVIPVSCLESVDNPPFHPEHRYGMKIVYNLYTEYCKPLDRYVKKYINHSTNSEIYSFTKTHIMVPAIAVNYAANGKDMVDTTGWAPEMAVDKLTVDKTDTGLWSVDANGIPILIPNSAGIKSPNQYGIIASKLTSGASNGTTVKVINTGPYSSKVTIDTPTTYALKLSYKWSKPDDHTSDLTGSAPIVKICQPIVSGIKDSYYKEIVTEASALDDDGNYVFSSNPLFTIPATSSDQYYLLNFDNSKLSNGPITDLFIVIEFSGVENQTKDFCITNLEFFEAWTYNGKHTKGTTGSGGVSRLISDSYIVPAWENSIYDAMGTYIDYLNGTSSTTGAIKSASDAYYVMEQKLEQWENSVQGREQYTLVTCNSIVSGKSFEEEIYFIYPNSQPQFADPYVIFLDPEENLNIYQLEALYNNYKYRTLKQEKSNRFNLSQQLSELFQVYPVYNIDYYPNGKIKKRIFTVRGLEITNDNYEGLVASYFKRNKTLYYTDQKGGENKYGFKYGHNLNSISRTIDSTDIVSKMFVTDNLSQYATDGICTIARAKDNISKDTFLLRFDYFINRNLITKEKVDNDLYSRTIFDNTHYNWEDFINPYRQGSDSIFITDADIKYREELDNFSSYSFESVIIYNGFLYTLGKINERYDKLSAEQANLEKHQLIVLEASVQTYTSALKSLREQLSKQKQLTSAYQKESVNKKYQEYIDSCQRIQSKIETYEIYLESAQYMYEMYADLYNRYECEMHFLLACKKKVEDRFNTKYEAFLKEGVWQDSKYLNDNAYYLDAEKVLVDSCGPKITYTLSVTDLSVLDKYAFADFSVGDITYVQDYEFFDDDPDENDKYYEEKTLVSVITCNLDNPSKNTISLQNYSTKFDDLFSRITASVQSLTFNENIYQRAANFTTTGQINEDSIQDTLDDNELTLVGNQDVQIDGNGILVTDLRIPSNKVKIVGSGIFLTATGGNSWYGAFENGGINASLLTVGAINTKSISIMNENYSNFLWDKNGITAYGTASSISNTDKTKDGKEKSIGSTYVRFNQYGLFFVNGDESFTTGLEELQSKKAGALDPEITTYIMNNAAVAITYDGFSINGAGGNVRFTSEDGIVMYDEDGYETLRLGYITGLLDEGIDNFWGLKAEGAYIEGKLFSDKVVARTVSLGGTGGANVIDRSRTMLYGGQLVVSRSIIEDTEDNAQSVVDLKRITTFGSVLYVGTDTETEANEDNAVSMNDYLDNLGSSIHIDKYGKFWSVGAFISGSKNYRTKLIYAREAVGPYNADTFYIKTSGFAGYANYTVLSDKNVKRNIQPLNEKYLKLFDKLQVKTFNYNYEEENKPKHIGLIAQEVIQDLKESGLDLQDLNAVHKIDQDTWGIDYTELLTIAIAKIKQLEERLQKLENK